MANGTTYTAHTMVWDAFGRLNKISQRNTGTSDYDWTTVYDGLGRRVQTTWQPMSSGTNSGASSYLRYYYDPQVEFLELGINDNGSRQWSAYGPDLNGIYGGQQGVGGAESYMTEGTAPIVQNINNFFGDTVGMAYTPVGMPGALYMQSYGLTLGAYGPQPGTGLYSNLIPQWRGRYADWTGYIWMGARYYEARSGRFLSADPLGHDGSLSLYDYANGDPLNGLDPDGRCSTAWSDSSSSSSYGYGYSSSSYGSGGSSLSDQMNEDAYVAMHPLSEQQQEWPTFDQVIDSALSLAVQATVGLSMSVAESVATHFYNGMTGTDINTGESISGWSRLGNAAMFATDIAPMVGEVKLGGGMLDVVSNIGRVSDDLDYGAETTRGFGAIGLDSLPTGSSSEALQSMYLEQAQSSAFGAKLSAWNTLTGNSVTVDQIAAQLSTNTEFRLSGSLLRSNINMTGNGFVIGGVENSGYFASSVIHHEMLHMAQFISNPSITTNGFIGLGHEILPSFLGTPAIYGGATLLGGGAVYGAYQLGK